MCLEHFFDLGPSRFPIGNLHTSRRPLQEGSFWSGRWLVGQIVEGGVQKQKKLTITYVTSET